MRFVFLVSFVLATVGVTVLADKTGGRNIIDVPIVCPEGQRPDPNGKCRPVWPSRIAVPQQQGQDQFNVIDVPVQCPEGQAPDPNGKCRPIWPMGIVHPRNIIDVPVTCPAGQRPDQNGKCRPIVQFVISFLKYLLG